MHYLTKAKESAIYAILQCGRCNYKIVGVILTSWHDMEGSRSFMELYKHQYQLHGMLIKNGLGCMTARIEHAAELLVGRGLDAQRL